MNYKFISAILAIILIVATGYYSYNYFKDKFIKQGYTDGYSRGGYDIIMGITQTGKIPFFIQDSGNLTLQTKSISDICEGK